MNVSKSKILIFRAGGLLPRHLSFSYEGEVLEIVKTFKYLGIVFTAGGSFSEAQNTLAGQVQKAICKLNKYLYVSPYINHNAVYILFWSFEISDNILRGQKYVIGLDSYSRQVSIYLDPILIYISL